MRKTHEIWNLVTSLSLVIVIASSTNATARTDDIKVPDYNGVHYGVSVPDTLDLAQRCGLAAQGMTTCVDPNDRFRQYFYVYFGRDPVYMVHDSLSDECTPKFIEALPFQRVASGNLINPACEQVWMQTILQNRTSSTAMIGRLIGAAGLYFTLTGEEQFKQAGIKMIETASKQMTFKDDYAYWPRAQYVPGPNTLYNPPADYDSAIWFVDGLVRFYKNTRYKPALDLAGKMTRAFFRPECFYYNDTGAFADAPLMWPGVRNKQHFHINALMRLACAEYAVTADDKKILEWVRKGYEYGKTHGEPLTGWFPEALSGPVNAVYNNSEMCAVADMVALSLKLSLAGAGDYWDDADRWIRNMLVEGQLTDVNWVKGYLDSPYCKAATAYDNEHREPDLAGLPYVRYLQKKFPAVCTDNVAQRNVGCFGGWVAMNDWFGGYDIGTGDMHGPGIMHCCTGNSSRSLYAAYYSILTYDKTANTLKINLLLNRASKYADVDSLIPYKGQVDITARQAIANLSVRMPGWVNLRDVKISIDGKEKQVTFDGRYAQCGKVAKGQKVTCRFPIKEETKTVRVSYYEKSFAIEESYMLTFKGNTVIDIYPQGKFCPLYKRAQYRSTNVPYKTVERFVCNKELTW